MELAKNQYFAKKKKKKKIFKPFSIFHSTIKETTKINRKIKKKKKIQK